MSINSIIRAWEDPEFRATLSELPESPVGQIELTEEELSQIVGARSGASVTCNTYELCCISSRGNSVNPCGDKC